MTLGQINIWRYDVLQAYREAIRARRAFSHRRYPSILVG